MTGRRPLGTALLLFALGGCTARPAAVAPLPPDVTLGAVKSVGSPLTTSGPAVDSIDADALIGLDVTWIALQKMPTDALEPLDALSSLASAPLAQGAVLSRGRDARLVRFGRGAMASEWLARQIRRQDGPAQQVGHQIVWVAPGTTIQLSCAAVLPPRSIAVAIYRPIASPTTKPTTTADTQPTSEPTTQDAAARIANFSIALRGIAATQPSDESAAGPETAYLEGLSLAPETPYALILPWPAATSPWTALAAYISVLRPGTPHAADAADWNQFLAARRGQPAPPATLPAEHLSLHRALDALAAAADPRPALAYLATVTQARVAADVVLVADANLLTKLRTAILATDTAAATPEAIGWLLDRTALLTLADAGSKASLPPEMVAALTVHAGEVGRHPDTLAEVVKSVGNAADLHTRLIGENYVALEDNAAAARVRAYDWLRGEGRAPADFDPLGTGRARRAAISRAIAPGGTP